MDLSISSDGDDLFDAAVGARDAEPRFRYNQDLKTLPGPLLWSVAAGVDMIREHLIKEAGPKRKIPEVVARTNRATSFGASAFKHEHRYFVSVNFGSLLLVQDLVHRVLSMREVFRWIGDPSREDVNRSFHPITRDAAVYRDLMKRDLRSPIPRDPSRENCGAMFTLIANEFVVSHELWHGVGGHLDWGASQSAPLVMEECVESFEMSSIAEDKRKRLIGQSLEMDADSFAVFQILRRLIALIDESKPHNGVKTAEQAVEVAVVCGAVMVGSFFGSAPDPERWVFLSHPPAAVRHRMMIHAADRALRMMKLESVRQVTTANPEWVSRMTNQIFVQLWNSIGNADRIDELKLSLGDAGNEHIRRVMEAWAGVSSSVRAFSPLPTYPLYPKP